VRYIPILAKFNFYRPFSFEIYQKIIWSKRMNLFTLKRIKEKFRYSKVIFFNNLSDFMEKTLVILKPSAIQRSLVGEVVSRFEKKGLQIVGMKMVSLSDAILEEHYAHLKEKPFFKRIKDSMQVTPVIVMALEGLEAVDVVRMMTGPTNGRKAQPGTIRGDFSVSVQENIVHASDSPESAAVELKRFFTEEEIFSYPRPTFANLYANDEL
jgi:nucleoside-diphosphate kinase